MIIIENSAIFNYDKSGTVWHKPYLKKKDRLCENVMRYLTWLLTTIFYI